MEPPEIVIFRMPTDMFYRLMQPVNYIVHFIWRLFKKLRKSISLSSGRENFKKIIWDSLNHVNADIYFLREL